jgi:Transposase DDE domain/Transposase domain (DUF772)
MRTINSPEEPEQKLLFDAEIGAWWLTQLSPEAHRQLSEGMEGVMRRSILKLLPAEKLGERFHEFLGRPTKELYAMCGLMLLAEFRDLTIDQAASAWSFDASVQYALNLPRDRQYLCARTLDTYRQLLREDESAQGIFEEVTAALVQELGVEIGKQRLDSTHVLSNMAKFGRLKLLAVTTKRFLTQLKRHHLEDYDALPEEMRVRYGVAESRIFGFGSKNAVPREEALQTVGEDMVVLLERFAEMEAIASRSSYKAMDRVFKEHCEVSARGRMRLTDKALDENGQSSRTLQNPSDEGAGYSGHKGSGYQVQLAQTCGHSEEGPGLIVGCVPQSAADSDSGAVALVVEQQQRMGTLPEEQLADTAYGSEANVALCAAVNVTLIAPVPGRAAAPRNEQKTAHQQVTTLAPSTWAEQRRAEQESDDWKKRYALRSGIEGVNEALDRTTGMKALRVRGKRAVHMAIYLRVTGWNIKTAATLLRNKARRPKSAPDGGADGKKGGSCTLKNTNRVRRSPSGCRRRHRRHPTPRPRPRRQSLPCHASSAHPRRP